MITIFNRKEILITVDVQKFYDVTGKLKNANIRYEYKINSPYRAGRSSFGINLKYNSTYYVYVHKKDLANAHAAMHKNDYN